MDSATIGTWGQKDLPTDATALFGPEDDPLVVQAASTTPGQNGYGPSTVHYLNASAQEVNTATTQAAGVPGAAIDTTAYDRFGNAVWTLQPTVTARSSTAKASSPTARAKRSTRPTPAAAAPTATTGSAGSPAPPKPPPAAAAPPASTATTTGPTG
jgi:hypothetical protein